jgi:hypothetical protein
VQTSDVVDEMREEECGSFRGSAMTSGLVVANVEEAWIVCGEKSDCWRGQQQLHSCFLPVN